LFLCILLGCLCVDWSVVSCCYNVVFFMTVFHIHYPPCDLIHNRDVAPKKMVLLA
jgi:hypothetical protein